MITNAKTINAHFGGKDPQEWAIDRINTKVRESLNAKLPEAVVAEMAELLVATRMAEADAIRKRLTPVMDEIARRLGEGALTEIHLEELGRTSHDL